MTSIFLKRLRETLRREDGMAIPSVLAMIVISTAFVAIAVASTTNTQRSSKRDSSSKAAIAAAEAGAGLALQRQNLVTTSSSTPCVIEGSSTLSAAAVGGNGYCAVVGPKTIGGGTYSYYVQPCYTACGAKPVITIISTGTTGGVSRRVAITASATVTGGTPVAFGNAKVVGVDYLTMGNGANVESDVGTNGVFSMTGGANVCGNIQYGTSTNGPPFPNGATQCSGYTVSQGVKTYPDVVAPSTNANARLACNPQMNNAQCLDRRSGDQYTIPSGGCTSAVAGNVTTPGWCESTKTLTIDNGTTRTMGDATNVSGGTYTDYVLCTLRVSGGGKLIMPTGARVRIIFDSPENCGLASGATQLTVDNGATVDSTGYNPGGGVFNLPGFYFVGSTGVGANFRNTYVSLQGGGLGYDMIVYGPKTYIDLANGVTWNGAMLGKGIDLQGGGWVKPSAALPSPDADLPVASSASNTAWDRTKYLECVGTLNVSAPITGC